MVAAVVVVEDGVADAGVVGAVGVAEAVDGAVDAGADGAVAVDGVVVAGAAGSASTGSAFTRRGGLLQST